MYIFFLKVLRRLFRSFSKYETNIIDKIIYKNFTLKKKIFLKSRDLSLDKIDKKKLKSVKLQIVICSYYQKKRLKFLKKVISNLVELNVKKKITVVTNSLSVQDKFNIKKTLKEYIKFFKIHEIGELPDTNLLPWHCLNLLKKKYKDKSNSHFLFLEDDILINQKNINYWLSSRDLIKKNNFIPGFLRIEIKNNSKYLIDRKKKIIIRKTPRLFDVRNKLLFINNRFPYHAMCLMDRKLMNELIANKSAGIDYGFHHKIMRNLYPIKELSNILIGYLNVPVGFYNRFFFPYIIKENIPDYCLVEHLDKKYTLGRYKKIYNIKINNLLI